MLHVVAGGLLILFSVWWLYFSKSAEDFLSSIRVPILWGYGHYFIFASIAAVGAGLAVNIDHITDHTALGDVGVSATITVPVAIFLCMLWFCKSVFNRVGRRMPFYLLLLSVPSLQLHSAPGQYY
ncbi:low temperature requirement protein A [Aliifodinibius sp. S!AR15-10]|uniref:low temperature requirement protein A n=1 Tax=Aliifodinibius sp. S!AR15-10 TaxID=2950437 RepID=UPI002861A67C|nr:low temperature requirement protein A [Aliifodinibius sp. S!AR15-10]